VSKFKVGDRVITTRAQSDKGIIPIGSTGVVITTSEYTYAIKWDKYGKGGLCISHTALKLVKRPKKNIKPREVISQDKQRLEDLIL